MKRNIKWVTVILSVFIMITLLPGYAFAASGDTIVYRTKTGKSYHTENCSSLKSSYALSLQEAVNLGLTPCSKCHPPVLDQTEESNTSLQRKSVKNFFGNGKRFEVVISAVCTENNSVGNNWEQEFSINGDVIEPIDIVAFNQNDELEIIARITEKDKYDDIGKAETIHTVTKTDFSKGFTVKQVVIVTENAGRYKWNTATWEVEYKFTRCD